MQSGIALGQGVGRSLSSAAICDRHDWFISDYNRNLANHDTKHSDTVVEEYFYYILIGLKLSVRDISVHKVYGIRFSIFIVFKFGDCAIIILIK